jgi:hypothetical protein
MPFMIDENPAVRVRGRMLKGKPKNLAHGHGNCCDKCAKCAKWRKQAHMWACRKRVVKTMLHVAKKDAFVKTVKKIATNVIANIIAKGICFKGKQARIFINNAIVAAIKPTASLHPEFVDGVINSIVTETYEKIHSTPKKRSNTWSARRADGEDFDIAVVAEVTPISPIEVVHEPKPCRPSKSKMMGFKPSRQAGRVTKMSNFSSAEEVDAYQTMYI